jgi:hypothetical protein
MSPLEILDEVSQKRLNHPKIDGKPPFLPLNPHHPTPTGESRAESSRWKMRSP